MNFWRFIFPPICQACGKVGAWLCEFCLADIEFFPNPIKLDASLMALNGAQAITYLQSPMRELIKALKYKKYPAIGQWLGEWVLDVIRPPPVDFISWVPLHATKQKWRGFNQSEIIARALAKKLALPCGNLIQKIAATSPQAQVLNKETRLTHLNEMFQLTPMFNKSENLTWLKTKRILLIDDVITTGSTLNAVSLPLKTAGCLEVHGLAIAHGQ